MWIFEFPPWKNFLRSGCSTPSHCSGCSGPACSLTFQSSDFLLLLTWRRWPLPWLPLGSPGQLSPPFPGFDRGARHEHLSWVFNNDQHIFHFRFHLLRSSAVYFPIPVFAPVIATKRPSNLVLLWYCRPWIFQDTIFYSLSFWLDLRMHNMSIVILLYIDICNETFLFQQLSRYTQWKM